jgi:DUF1365 family protein
MHQRLRPLRHRLHYRVYSLLLDVDELPTLASRLRLFSLNRFNLFSLHERDYGDGAGLRAHVDRQLLASGFATGGAIRLLTMPRILGYAFNPISVYFCHRADGALEAILYEVNNTFGERHSYLLGVHAPARAGGIVRQSCAKAFHVSPFLDLQMRYAFEVQPPSDADDALAIGITAHDGQGPVLVAHHQARRRSLTDGALARVFFSHPLLTLKVIAGIHWEALRLWLKGARVHRHTAAPTHPVTIVKSTEP